MNIKININQIEKFKEIPLECYECKGIFFVKKRYVIHEIKHNNGKHKFCSKSCYGKSQLNGVKVNCKNCGLHFIKNNYESKKTKNNFCSRSCAATYNNKHKTSGTRRSKLEQWIEKRLTILYPNLEIHFNRKDAINSELDIYIPSLKLAFELNGIFHYEPIYGDEKLNQIQNNDNRKFQACAEKQISLCVIDTSTLKYFKEQNAHKFLKIISDTINKPLVNK